MVKYVKKMEEFEALMKLSDTKLVVIDFTATWCPPCQMIKPFFESLPKDFPSVEFVKVDVDDAADVSAKCGIECMPTFQFYKNGTKIDELQGASKDKLKQLIEKHASSENRLKNRKTRKIE